MIVTVSTTTLSALDPDHSARTKPTEMTSKRGPRSTSSSVGTTIVSTVCDVNTCEARSTSPALNCPTRWSVKVRTTTPIEPVSPKSSGGIDSSAKKAASAASPVTRLRRQLLTVDTTRCQKVDPARANASRTAVSSGWTAALRSDPAAMRPR